MPARREYSCSRPPRRERQTTSPIGSPSSSLPSGARSPRLRCGRARLWCSTYSFRTCRRRRSPVISNQSNASRRKNTIQSPRANAIGERVSLRQGCLDHILPLSEEHVRSVLAEFVSSTTRIGPIDRSDWRLQCRALARSTGKWSPDQSSAACIPSTNEPPDPDSPFAALHRRRRGLMEGVKEVRSHGSDIGRGVGCASSSARSSGHAGDLEYVLKEFVEHYQEARQHQGLDQRTPSGQPAMTPLAVGRIVLHDRLGGLIHEYDRAAP